MTAMLNFEDGKSFDADEVEDILVKQMMVGQKFNQGNLSGMRNVPKSGLNSFKVEVGIRGSEAKSIANDLAQAEAVRLKDMIRDAIRNGGIVEVPMLVIAVSEAGA